MSDPTRLSPWLRQRSERVYSARVFDVLRDRAVSPRTGREHDFHVLECSDWVNVVPITPDDQVVLIRQFLADVTKRLRYATNALCCHALLFIHEVGGLLLGCMGDVCDLAFDFVGGIAHRALGITGKVAAHLLNVAAARLHPLALAADRNRLVGA